MAPEALCALCPGFTRPEGLGGRWPVAGSRVLPAGYPRHPSGKETQAVGSVLANLTTGPLQPAPKRRTSRQVGLDQRKWKLRKPEELWLPQGRLALLSGINRPTGPGSRPFQAQSESPRGAKVRGVRGVGCRRLWVMATGTLCWLTGSPAVRSNGLTLDGVRDGSAEEWAGQNPCPGELTALQQTGERKAERDGFLYPGGS